MNNNYGTNKQGQQMNMQQSTQYQVNDNTGNLKTNRGMGKFLLFGILTCGIYTFYFVDEIAKSINQIASKRDGKQTKRVLPLLIFSILTCGIYSLVWYHKLSERVGKEAALRGYDKKFGAGTYWGWCTLGLLAFGLGPLEYINRLCQAMNYISNSYNNEIQGHN